VSVGDHHPSTEADHRLWLGKFHVYLRMPEFVQALQRYQSEDDTHDVPYLGGSDRAGACILFDRQFVAAIKAGKVLYKGKPYDPRPFIRIHEAVEGVLIRMFHLDYDHAHLIATAAERAAVEHAGLNWDAYSNSLAPFIRADEQEKIKDPPPNLLLDAYKGTGGSTKNPMYQRLLMARGNTRIAAP
jgi:hypothetical protein